MRTSDPKQRWLTYVHHHAKVMVACDFFVVITAAFCTLYVFLVMEIGSRRIFHYNVTARPTAEWTLQQFREALPGDHAEPADAAGQLQRLCPSGPSRGGSLSLRHP